MMIHNLFPTPVGQYNLNRDLFENEKNFINSLKLLYNNNNPSSEDKNVLDNLNLQSLRSFIEDSLINYFNLVYNPSDQVIPFITQSWVNFKNDGQGHYPHFHTNSFISGVFYINTFEPVNKIFFHKDSNNFFKFNYKNFNEWNSEAWWIKVNSGDLILFSSRLTHSVEKNFSKENRISLSFNTFLKGSFGDYHDVNFINLPL